MRRITCRLTAAVLSACLALSPLGALAEQPMMTAQVELPMNDGSQMLLPIQTLITSTGETVYWLDMSQLDAEQIEALAMAQMMLYDETGELMGQYLFGALEDGVIELYDAIDPEITVPMMLAPSAMPDSLEEAESVLAEYGFMDGSFEEDDWAEQERLAAEQAAREEAERIAAEEAAREEAERIAAEEAAREEAERLAAEQAAREEAERLAAEEAAREEAERLAAEQAEREEAERLAAEQAAREEAERLAAEQAAREEAERLAAEQKRLEEELAAKYQQIAKPDYVIPFQDETGLYAEPVFTNDNMIAQLYADDVLVVESPAIDMDGRLWWYATDCRTGLSGFVMDEMVGEVSEDIYNEFMLKLNGEYIEPEITEDVIESEIAEPEITEPEITEPETSVDEQVPNFDEIIQSIVVPGYVFPYEDNTNLRSEPLTSEDNVLMQVHVNDVLTVSGYAVDAQGRVWWQATDYRSGTSGFIMADVTAQLDEQAFAHSARMIDAEKNAALDGTGEDRLVVEAEDAERIAAEEAARLEAERLAAEAEPNFGEEFIIEEEANDEQAAQPEQPEQQEQQEQEQQESEPQEPAVRYAITSNRNNPTNNLRAKADSKADVVGVYENGELLIWDNPTDDGKWYPVTVVRDGAQGYMRDYLLTEIPEADAQIRMAEILAEKAGQEEFVEPEQTEDEPADIEIETEDEETYENLSGETEDETDGNGAELIVPDETGKEEYPLSSTIAAFPAYAMTLAQENNVAIVLREEPAGGMPQSGAVPMIVAPTPLEITEEKLDGQGNVWYLARNLNTGDVGYLEAFKVELVSKEIAEANVMTQTDELPPVPSDNPTSAPEEDYTGEDEPQDEPEIVEPIEPEEPELPDTPQELTEGDIYHYGRNNGKQVALRAEPNTNGKLHYRMEAGTVLWVMSMENDWCHVRTDRGEGYVMAKFVDLMNVREESEYISTLDDPEVAPESSKPEISEPETDEPELIAPEVTDPNYPELIVPEVTKAPETEPTTEPTAEPTAEPTKQPEEKPTATPAPQELDRYAVVTVDNTQLRSNPTMDAYLQCEIAVDGVVYAMRTEMNDKGELWTLVKLENEWGYVLTDNIRLMSDEEQENYLAALEAAKATPTPTLEPTATPKPTATPEPQRLEIYARVINDGTPLRGNPDANAYLQNILEEETVVFLFQSQIAADGMTWYLVQHSGQWGYIRADLVRPMGEQETADYLAQLEAELATPTPMPQATPEPVGPDSTSAYAKLVKDKVNLRRTPSSSGTSLDRVPINTLLLVLGSEYDGTNTWYQVSYNGHEGYIRSDMAKMLTIAELEDHFEEQMQQAQQTKPGASVTPNKNNNTDIVINGSQLQDLIPVDGSWTNNVISGMPLYATATPDPNATPTPQPPEKSAPLIRSSGEITVSNVPALTREATFSVYGKTKAYTTVTATVDVTVQTGTDAAVKTIGFVSTAIAENTQTVKKTVGQAVSDANGLFEMTVTLPEAGEYIVEFTAADGAFAQYGVTYDTGATPLPTLMPLPTSEPLIEEERGGLSIWPFAIGGLLIVIAAAIYGVYVYRRRSEEDEEDEEDLDDETELRQAQLNMQRQRAASAAAPKAPAVTSTVIPGAQRMPKAPASTDVPAYMKNQQSPYARPQAPIAPQAPAAPKAPVAPQAPAAPKAPVAPQAPAAPKAPVAPQAPASDAADVSSAPRRRRRPPVDPQA